MTAVAAANPAADPAALAAGTPGLLVYRTGLVQSLPGENRLAYRVEVSDGARVRDQVFIDALTGKVLDRFAMIPDGLYRELYSPTLAPADLKWKEGDAWPTDTEYQNILNGTGESDDLDWATVSQADLLALGSTGAAAAPQ